MEFGENIWLHSSMNKGYIYSSLLNHRLVCEHTQTQHIHTRWEANMDDVRMHTYTIYSHILNTLTRPPGARWTFRLQWNLVKTDVGRPVVKISAYCDVGTCNTWTSPRKIFSRTKWDKSRHDLSVDVVHRTWRDIWSKCYHNIQL
jgi:hypothetical protein